MSVDSLILISGGLDSVVLAHQLVKDRKVIRGLHFDFGLDSSRHELDSAKKTTFQLGIPLEVVDVSSISKLIFGYAPLEYILAAELDVLGVGVIASGYSVPLSVATYYAQLTGINDIEVAAVKEQKETRPKLEAFFAAWPKTINLLNNKSPSFSVSAPFLNMAKAEVVKLGVSLNVPISESWSCQKATAIHCGDCPRCKARKKAFADAGVNDDTNYLQ
jgi:7-cyano-7-deazaguanine synthase